jgi:hypothetical protein
MIANSVSFVGSTQYERYTLMFHNTNLDMYTQPVFLTTQKRDDDAYLEREEKHHSTTSKPRIVRHERFP